MRNDSYIQIILRYDEGIKGNKGILAGLANL